MELPRPIAEHVDDFIRRTNWPKVAADIGDPCEGCPGRGWVDTHPDDREHPPCFSCPLWALKLDLTELTLRRHLDLGPMAPEQEPPCPHPQEAPPA